jgi:hypothetical protein
MKQGTLIKKENRALKTIGTIKVHFDVQFVKTQMDATLSLKGSLAFYR